MSFPMGQAPPVQRRRRPGRPLARMRSTTRHLRRRAAADPLKYFRWLPAQHAFLTDTSKRRLLRAGNQAHGKTTAGLAEVLYLSLGHHPHKTVSVRAPIEAWVICASWAQSVAIQAKLWAMAPKWAVAPGQSFDPVRGFGGKTPALRLRNGSIIRIKTTQQGALNLAGATIHVALFDEPPASPRVYGEVLKRVMRKNGYVLMSMTPVNARIDWLKESVEKGQITDLHFDLRPEYLIPVGQSKPMRLTDGTVMDAAWIETIVAETLHNEVPVVVHGEWEMRVEGRVLRAFRASGPDAHVSKRMPRGEYDLLFGVDYGTKIGKQFACLVASEGDAFGDGAARTFVVDETPEVEDTTPTQDARNVLRMLQRNGLDWSDLTRAHGDRVHLAGSVDKKSNKDLAKALAKLTGLGSYKSLRPMLRTVKRGEGRGKGSERVGLTYLHRSMVRPGGFSIHPRCTQLIDAISKYDGRDTDAKDKIDALRYSVWSESFGARRHKGGDVELRLYA